MRKSLLFLLFAAFFIGKAQIIVSELPQEWLKVKTKMLDGSRDVSEPFLQTKFYRWQISQQKLCTDSDPVSANGRSCVDYKIEKNFIRTSPESGYEIIKLTKDSLTAIERIAGIDEPDKIRQLWFASAPTVKNQMINAHKNDSALTATEVFTPVLNKNFVLDLLADFSSKNNFPVFSLKGNIVFYPKENKLGVEVTNQDDKAVRKNEKSIAAIKASIEKTYSSWNLSGFKNFDKISLPFIIKSYNKDIGDGWSSKGTPIYYFFTDDRDIEKIKGISYQDQKSANENFKNGIKAIQENKYDRAVEYFNRSYELDHRKTDALYNIANIYLSKKDLVNECAYLEKLKDIGQTEGIRRFDEKCVKL